MSELERTNLPPRHGIRDYAQYQ
uniref:Uncharacterized protein n=1 Tax=Arundo donax TaxID=35708 RepID=A0A0A9FTA2_ARUDO